MRGEVACTGGHRGECGWGQRLRSTSTWVFCRGEHHHLYRYELLRTWHYQNLTNLPVQVAGGVQTELNWAGSREQESRRQAQAQALMYQLDDVTSICRYGAVPLAYRNDHLYFVYSAQSAPWRGYRRYLPMPALALYRTSTSTCTRRCSADAVVPGPGPEPLLRWTVAQTGRGWNWLRW